MARKTAKGKAEMHNKVIQLKSMPAPYTAIQSASFHNHHFLAYSCAKYFHPLLSIYPPQFLKALVNSALFPTAFEAAVSRSYPLSILPGEERWVKRNKWRRSYCLFFGSNKTSQERYFWRFHLSKQVLTGFWHTYNCEARTTLVLPSEQHYAECFASGSLLAGWRHN